MSLLTMYQGTANSPATALASSIDDQVTEIEVNYADVLPPGPNLAVISNGLQAETILYQTIQGTKLMGVTRGFEGGATYWSSGTPILRNFTAYDYNTLVLNILTSYCYEKSIMNLYIDSVNGNDINTGLINAPLQSIGAALDKLPLIVDDATLNLANGSYTIPNGIIKRKGSLKIIGHQATPGSITITNTNAIFKYLQYIKLIGVSASGLIFEDCNNVDASYIISSNGVDGIAFNRCLQGLANNCVTSINSRAGIKADCCGRVDLQTCSGITNLYGIIANTSRVTTSSTNITGTTPTRAINGGVIAAVEAL